MVSSMSMHTSAVSPPPPLCFKSLQMRRIIISYTLLVTIITQLHTSSSSISPPPSSCFPPTSRLYYPSSPTYLNNPTVSITPALLPQNISLLSGGWDTAILQTRLVYYLLSEQLGLGSSVVSLWPFDSAQGNLDLYYQILGGNQQDPFIKLENGNISIEVEQWTGGVEEYVVEYTVDHQTVLNMGSSGMIGHSGWYIPAYMANQFPELLLGTQIIHHLDVFNSTLLPGTNRIPFYASSSTDVQTHQSMLLLQFLGLAENFTIISTGNDTAEYYVLSDLIQRRVPFLSVIGRPHALFVEYENELVRVTLPANPCECATSSCFIRGTCDFPPNVVLKLMNRNLQKYEEIQYLFGSYSIDNTQLEEMLYTLIHYNSSATTMDPYSHAACTFLRNHQNVWSSWLLPWQAKTCPVDCEYGVCGVPGDTTACLCFDGSIAAGGGTQICNASLECGFDPAMTISEFRALTLSSSLTPYQQWQNLTCSSPSHGVCNKGACQCLIPWEAPYCNYQIPFYQINTAVIHGVQAVTLLSVLVVLSQFIFLIKFWSAPVYRATSRALVAFLLIPLTLFCGGASYYTVIPDSSSSSSSLESTSCIGRLWFTCLPLACVLGVLVSRLARLHTLFNSTKIQVESFAISDGAAALRILVVILLELVLLLVLTISSLTYPSISTTSIGGATYQLHTCDTSGGFASWLFAQLAYFILLLAITSYLSFKTHKLPSAFNEVSHLTLCIVIILLFIIILIPASILVQAQPASAIFIQGFGQLLCGLCLTCILYLPKVYHALTLSIDQQQIRSTPQFSVMPTNNSPTVSMYASTNKSRASSVFVSTQNGRPGGTSITNASPSNQNHNTTLGRSSLDGIPTSPTAEGKGATSSDESTSARPGLGRSATAKSSTISSISSFPTPNTRTRAATTSSSSPPLPSSLSSPPGRRPSTGSVIAYPVTRRPIQKQSVASPNGSAPQLQHYNSTPLPIHTPANNTINSSTQTSSSPDAQTTIVEEKKQDNEKINDIQKEGDAVSIEMTTSPLSPPSSSLPSPPSESPHAFVARLKGRFERLVGGGGSLSTDANQQTQLGIIHDASSRDTLPSSDAVSSSSSSPDPASGVSLPLYSVSENE